MQVEPTWMPGRFGPIEGMESKFSEFDLFGLLTSLPSEHPYMTAKQAADTQEHLVRLIKGRASICPDLAAEVLWLRGKCRQLMAANSQYDQERHDLRAEVARLTELLALEEHENLGLKAQITMLEVEPNYMGGGKCPI